MVVDPMGKVLTEAGEGEEIVYADIGEQNPLCSILLLTFADPKTLEETRKGIPVTTQRRFDVYPDVSSG